MRIKGSFKSITNLDEAGSLLITDDNRLIRIINPKYNDKVKELFKSGFIHELIDKELFVPSILIEDGDTLYVEHELIDPVLYPFEWTFSMLKEAALVVLEIFEIAKKYNIGMKDCHHWNVLFKNGKPLYIDLGTFITDKKHYLIPYKEFLESYYFPLHLWSQGLEYTVKYAVLYRGLYPSIEYYTIMYKLLKYLPTRILKKIISMLNKVYILPYIEDNKIMEKISNKQLAQMLMILRPIAKFFVEKNVEKIKKKIKGLELRMVTEWEGYYENEPKLTPRFQRILTYISEICKDCESLISFGSNQGFLEYNILCNTHIKRAICCDVDSKAIDIGFKKYSNNVPHNKKIYYIHYNVLYPIVMHPFMDSGYNRFRSDIVLALALTHHLMLREGFRLEYILSEFSKYCNRFAFIEFMPLGLWVPGVKASVPDWYNEEYFEEIFRKYFNLIVKEKLEENRILFIGEIKKTQEISHNVSIIRCEKAEDVLFLQNNRKKE